MKDETARTKQRQKVIDEVRLKKLKDSVIWKKAFGTEDGKACLELLKEHYYDVSMIAHNDTIVTQNRAAQRDLVRYIIDQIEYTGE